MNYENLIWIWQACHTTHCFISLGKVGPNLVGKRQPWRLRTYLSIHPHLIIIHGPSSTFVFATSRSIQDLVFQKKAPHVDSISYIQSHSSQLLEPGCGKHYYNNILDFYLAKSTAELGPGGCRKPQKYEILALFNICKWYGDSKVDDS